MNVSGTSSHWLQLAPESVPPRVWLVLVPAPLGREHDRAVAICALLTERRRR